MSPVAQQIPFDNNSNNHFLNSNVQETIEEARKTDSFYTQATSSSTLILSENFQKVLVFTGTTTGQIVRLPSALGLPLGTWYTIINSTDNAPITIENGSSTVLFIIGAGEAKQLYCAENSTVAGIWKQITPLAIFGSQYTVESSIAETSTTSTTTYAVKVNLTTANLPAGDYRLNWSLQWRAANANRGIQIQVIRDTVQLANYIRFSASVNDNPPEAGFIILPAQTSGVKNYQLNFRVGIGATTIFVSNAFLELWRVK